MNKVAHDTNQVKEKMKTRNENYKKDLKSFFEKENEKVMQEVYRKEIADMQRLAEYGFVNN